MDELLEDIERVTDILNMLKSRFFLLRAKYDSGNVLIILY